jgi:hypothetical protein
MLNRSPRPSKRTNQCSFAPTRKTGHPSRRPIATYNTGSDAHVPPNPVNTPGNNNPRASRKSTGAFIKSGRYRTPNWRWRIVTTN